MKMLIDQSTLIKAAVIALISVSFSAQADLNVQSAQYKAKKEALFIKGKLSGGTISDRVFVLDATNNAFIGTIDTKKNNRNFHGELVMPSEDTVPCVVKVQVNPPRRSRGRSGDFDISFVRHAADSCDELRL